MKGTIELPGDKSISHRVAMIAAIAEGPCQITNFNSGADCGSTLMCLNAIGTEITGDLVIEPRPLHPADEALDCGNSGTTMRLLMGFLAGQDIPATLIGDVSLLRRPMRRVADPLREMGAVIGLRDEEFPPVQLKEGAKRAIVYRMPVSSAQVKSAVLLAGLRFSGMRVLEPVPSRDHTERLLEYLQVAARQTRKQNPIPAFDYAVPGDPSAAAFFVAAALMKKDSDLTFRNVLMNPQRTSYLRKLQTCGANIEASNRRLIQNELIADMRVRGGKQLQPIVIQPEEVPALIDEIPALAVLGSQYGFQVSGAAELRVKESDRIDAMVSNLDALGIYVEESEDGFRVERGSLQDGMAKTFGDHRIAMAFAAAGIEIDDPECVRISFPNFFEILGSIS
jgi:3-phosphoshikimate 1-carboxyvinyltransferase